MKLKVYVAIHHTGDESRILGIYKMKEWAEAKLEKVRQKLKLRSNSKSLYVLSFKVHGVETCGSILFHAADINKMLEKTV